MSAQILREAASLMRSRAEAATPGPWGNPEADFGYGDFGWYVQGCPAGETEDSERGRADIKYIASMHPAVALELAAFLDFAAAYGDQPEPQSPTVQFALSIANAYLATP